MERREGDEEMSFVTDKIFLLIGKVVGSRFVMNRCSGIILEIVSFFFICEFFFGRYTERGTTTNNRKKNRRYYLTFPTYLIYPTENHHK